MSDPSSPPTPAVNPDDLRIVLFGLPAAGKSSLLGALAQAAQAQEHLLHGHLSDPTHGLDELRQRLYDEAPRRTADEVVPYPVAFEPFADGAAPGRQPLRAVVIDCDGRVANDLLVRRQELDEHSPEGTLAHEVVEADALVLVIDAAAPDTQLEADFAEFDRFLRQTEGGRARRTEVAGLPVFLVLTKCDLLAQPGDTAATWAERIEQRKREVEGRFRSFFARCGGGAFGRLDLHLWATAVKRPALADVPAKPREPYGVAELFRQALEAAAAHRARERRATRRLAWTVGVAAALLVAMGSLSAGLIVKNRITRADALGQRVNDLRQFDSGDPAVRLRGPLDALRARERTLQEIRDNPLFPELHADQRGFVTDRLEELEVYIPYLEKLAKERPLGTVRREQTLNELRERLQKDLALPRPDWSDTDAGRLRKQRLEQIDALRRAVERARNWYLDGSEEAVRLWSFAAYKFGPEDAGIDWPEWSAQVEKLLDRQRKPPFGESEVIPGAAPLTYATALRFDMVVDAKRSWEAERVRLNRLQRLTAALGLATAKDLPPVLVVPRGVTLDGARALFEKLRTAYPDYRKIFVLEGLPDAVVAKIRQEARRYYAALLEPGRAEVLRKLKQAGQGSEETPERWEAVRRWLKEPLELNGWSELAAVLARLADPKAPDPVRALAEFLGQDRFGIEIRGASMEVPERLGVRPRADAAFKVYQPASGRQPALALEQSADPRRDPRRNVWVYTFRAAKRDRLVFRPGNKLWAELPLRDGRTLTWAEARSALYPFECLHRPPRLQDKDATTLSEGSVQEGVRLAPSPEGGVPRVPDLMPAVRPNGK
jgi:hypothetical protein